MQANNNSSKKRQRAFSHRSRTGCFTCRKRRIKCDERRPICKNCNRGQRQCKFPFSLSGERSPNERPSQMDMENIPALSMPPPVQPTPLPSQPILRDMSSPVMNQHQQQHYQHHRGGLDPSNATGHHMPTLPPITSITSQQQHMQQPPQNQQYNQLHHQHLHNYYQQVYGHMQQTPVPHPMGVHMPPMHYQQQQHQPPLFNTPYNGYSNNIHHINIPQHQANNRTISNLGATSLQQHQHNGNNQQINHMMLPFSKGSSPNQMQQQQHQQQQAMLSKHTMSQAAASPSHSSSNNTGSSSSSSTSTSSNGNFVPIRNRNGKHSFHLN